MVNTFITIGTNLNGNFGNSNITTTGNISLGSTITFATTGTIASTGLKINNKLVVNGSTLPPNGNALIIGELFADWGSNAQGGAFRMASNSNQAFIASNQYYNSGVKYNTTGGSSSISFDTTTGASAGNITFLTAPSGTVDTVITNTTKMTIGPNGIGFYATSPVAKPTVTGSKGANAALTSLLTALNTLGLLTDSSS